MILISKYSFDGPYPSVDQLRDAPGVFIVVCEQDEKLRLLDVDDSDTVKSSIRSHARKACWQENCENMEIEFAVYYSGKLPGIKRRDIVSEIRSQYDTACG